MLHVSETLFDINFSMFAMRGKRIINCINVGEIINTSLVETHLFIQIKVI